MLGGVLIVKLLSSNNYLLFSECRLKNPSVCEYLVENQMQMTGESLSMCSLALSVSRDLQTSPVISGVVLSRSCLCPLC